MRLFLVALILYSLPLHADTESEIRAALDYFAEVWNEGDLDAVRSYYHSGFVVIGEDGAIPLKQRIGDLESIAQAGEDRGKLMHSQVRVKSLGDDHALAWGRRSLSFEDGSGFENWFTTVYVKTPFGWKALHSHN